MHRINTFKVTLLETNKDQIYLCKANECEFLLSTNIRLSLFRCRRNIPLQTWDDLCHHPNNLGVLAIALIAPTPPWISANLHYSTENVITQGKRK